MAETGTSSRGDRWICALGSEIGKEWHLYFRFAVATIIVYISLQAITTALYSQPLGMALVTAPLA